MNADEKFIKQIQSGYRLDKPDFAPNSIAEVMTDCWKAQPKERPTFSQIIDRIDSHLETAVSEHYLDLNFPYAKINEEYQTASSQDYFGLSKLLDSKPTISLSRSLSLKTTHPRFSVRSIRKMAFRDILSSR